MTKNNRFLLAIAIGVGYTFISGVVKQYGSPVNFIYILASLLVVMFLTVLSANIALRFGQKYLQLGEKHKEDMTNFGGIVVIPASVAVFLYTMDWFDGIFLNILYVLIGALGLYMIISYIIDYVKINEDSIEGRYITQWKKTEIRFDEITEVKFSSLLNNLVLISKDKKLYVDVALVDSKLVLNTLTERLDKELLKDAFADLESYYKAFLVKENIEELTYFNLEK